MKLEVSTVEYFCHIDHILIKQEWTTDSLNVIYKVFIPILFSQISGNRYIHQKTWILIDSILIRW